MTFRLASRLVPSLAVAALAAACAVGTNPAAGAEGCDRVASPTGSDRAAGTEQAPFRSAQRLADSLRPGMTGCLREGTYDQVDSAGYVLKVFRGGEPGAPVTIRSYPGERARLVGGQVYVPQGSDHVRLSGLLVDGSRTRNEDGEARVSIHLMARDGVLENSLITNGRTKTCVLLGSNRGWGRAERTLIRGNLFTDCGDPGHGMLDHGIYAENAVDVEIVDNVFRGSSAYAVHLYPNAQRTRVAHNVMDGNGGGVIFAGEGDLASSGNVVERNVIANTTEEPLLRSYWGDRVGSGNVARDNCLYNRDEGLFGRLQGFAAMGNVEADPGFADRAAGDLRLAPGSRCLDVVGYDPASRVPAAVPGASEPQAARRPARRRVCKRVRRKAGTKRVCRAKRSGRAAFKKKRRSVST